MTSEYQEMTIPQLKKRLAEKGLRKGGSKAVLIQRLEQNPGLRQSIIRAPTGKSGTPSKYRGNVHSHEPSSMITGNPFSNAASSKPNPPAAPALEDDMLSGTNVDGDGATGQSGRGRIARVGATMQAMEVHDPSTTVRDRADRGQVEDELRVDSADFDHTRLGAANFNDLQSVEDTLSFMEVVKDYVNHLRAGGASDSDEPESLERFVSMVSCEVGWSLACQVVPEFRETQRPSSTVSHGLQALLDRVHSVKQSMTPASLNIRREHIPQYERELAWQRLVSSVSYLTCLTNDERPGYDPDNLIQAIAGLGQKGPGDGEDHDSLDHVDHGTTTESRSRPTLRAVNGRKGDARL